MRYEKLEYGFYYHIYNRGNNKENLFKEEMNYDYFLRLMKKHLLPVSDIYSYCLLKNHFHLLVRIKDNQESKGFSQSFSNMCNAYAKAVNKKYGRTGSLFQTRFKRVKITDEDHLRNVILYINLNPVHHNFTNYALEYKHSSLPTLLSYKKAFLKKEEVWELFESRDNFKYIINSKTLKSNSEIEKLFLE